MTDDEPELKEYVVSYNNMGGAEFWHPIRAIHARGAAGAFAVSDFDLSEGAPAPREVMVRERWSDTVETFRVRVESQPTFIVEPCPPPARN